MNRIAKIHINNFKFFGQEKPIELDSKHLLLYGENGSGKSTIYWAVYTIFEAAIKNNDEDINKYFRKGEKEFWSLVNVHADEITLGSGNYDSFIQVATDNVGHTPFRIALKEVAIRGNEEAKKVNYASDFIQYKLLQSLHGFWHKDAIDLYDFFADHTLQHVQFDESVISRGSEVLKLTNAKDIWDQLLEGPDLNELGYKQYAKLIADFNIGMNKLIDYVNLHANKFLNLLGYATFSFQLKYSDVDGSKRQPNVNDNTFHIALVITEYEGQKNVVHRAQSFLNEAKLSAMGIAVRLAVLNQKLSHNGLKFIVLDDLLISLDMRNREKVLDLFLSDDFAKNYQLLILTHDRHFYEMAKGKIKAYNQKEDWVYYEMYSKEEAGVSSPYYRKEEGYLGKAMSFYNAFENDVAANFLRKEAEAFCKRFLPTRLAFASDGKYKDLSPMLDQAVLFADQHGIDKTAIKVVNRYRQFVLNPSSHDSYDVPKFRNELMLCHEALTALDEIKILRLIPKNDELYFEVKDTAGTWRVEIILDDELRLLQEVGKSSILLLGRINYTVSKNGAAPAKGTQSAIENIGKMYDKCYAKANITGVADFWDGIFIKETSQPLRSIRAF